MTTYRVLQRLWYPSNPAIIRRLKRGENLPMKERGLQVVAPGAVVTDLPAESIPDLMARGLIEAVEVDGE